jgi:hypothetical protein
LQKQSKSIQVTEFVVLLTSLAFSILFLIDVYDAEDIAVGLLPNIVAVICILFSVSILAGNIMRAGKANAVETVHDAAAESAAVQSTGLLSWWWSYLTMAGYVLLILLIGLMWATFLYTLLIPVLMRYKNWKIIVIMSVTLTAFMHAAFSLLLQISLPTGILF